jgi:hypothetical protein
MAREERRRHLCHVRNAPVLYYRGLCSNYQRGWEVRALHNATDLTLSPLATDLTLSPLATDLTLSPLATDLTLSPLAFM